MGGQIVIPADRTRGRCTGWPARPCARLRPGTQWVAPPTAG